MPEQAPAKSGNTQKLILLCVVVIGLVVASILLPVGEWLTALLEWLRELGAWGILLFVVAYIVATVLFLPGAILTLGAGAVYGLLWGFIAVSIGSTIGATFAFLIGRFFARDAIAARVEGNARFEAIDQAVEREGAKIVFLTRLSPVFPFNLINYAYGLTKLPWWKFTLASWIGMMPGTFVYVYLGRAAGGLAEAVAGNGDEGLSGMEIGLLVVGLIATIAVTVVITRIATRALAQSTGIEVKNDDEAGKDDNPSRNVVT